LDPDRFLTNIPLAALLFVFVLTAVRQIGSFRIQLWHAMLTGALVVLFTGEIDPLGALESINADVMLFLFGMFVVGQGLEESGYLAHLSYHYFRRARTRDTLLLMILFGGGIASAFVMNDTLAIIGTPVVLLLARKHEMSPQLLLLSLAFAITIGSVMSPIGNPQNLLVALHGPIDNPFVTFLRYLFVPTMLNLLIAFFLLRRYFPDDFHEAELKHSQEPIRDHELAVLSSLSIKLVLILVAAKIFTAPFGLGDHFRLTHIALTAALPILVGSSRRWNIFRRIDWPTLIFFASMFVLMESVWRTGIIQAVVTCLGHGLTGIEAVLAISVLLSQLISNVPLVALYQPLLLNAGGTLVDLMALAAGSTIAGNLLILGAASNVIIIQNAERRGKESISFLAFARVGIPLTIVNVFVYWVFLRYI
jgi:Na+/H+ antiporter NhaD/arsenite permease-like protein